MDGTEIVRRLEHNDWMPEIRLSWNIINFLTTDKDIIEMSERVT